MSLDFSWEEMDDLAAWVFEHFSGCIREVSCRQIQYGILNASPIPRKVEECLGLLRSQGGESDLAVLSPFVVGELKGVWGLLDDMDTRLNYRMGGSAVFADHRAMTFEGEGVNPYVVELQGFMGG